MCVPMYLLRVVGARSRSVKLERGHPARKRWQMRASGAFMHHNRNAKNMNKTKMRNLFGLLIALICLAAITPAAHAAKPNKASKTAQLAKERLVLMPLRVPEEDNNLLGSMEIALVKGLQQQYEVFSGEQVAKKAKEIFLKESRNTAKRECDETRCMQGIAEAFQAELLATANVTKRDGGYFLALSIQNIFDNKVVYSESLACKGCDAFQVVDKLKELSGAPAPAASPAALDSEAPTVASGNATDAETALWNEVKTTSILDDYQTYLTQYPKGKYVALAKSRIKKVQEEAANEAVRKEQQAWQAAEQAGGETDYQGYLNGYPQGKYAGLAQIKIRKLKNDIAAREEQALWQTVQTSEDSKIVQSYLDKYPNSSHLAAVQDKLAAIKKAEAEMKPGKVFKDCPDCPEMVEIPKGSFDMGETGTTHRVTLAKPFAIGKTEVTQGQWKAVMGSNPSYFANCGDTCPVEGVSWDDAQAFIQKLNSKTGKQYRLPSEAEWEYACRAGRRHEYCGSNDIGSVAWYGAYVNPKGNSGETTNPVATKQANAFGLYDMSGNVWEWVEDSWHGNYSGAPTDGSAWPGDGAKRVRRGGSWKFKPQNARAAFRFWFEPAIQDTDVGFRLARMLP